MSGFNGSNSLNDRLKPVWKLAERNNQKPKVVNVHKSKSVPLPLIMN